MLQNNIELDLKEQIVNKTFVKMMDELGYDVELTYKKKVAD